MKKYTQNKGVKTPSIEQKPPKGKEMGSKGNSGTQDMHHDGTSTKGGS